MEEIHGDWQHMRTSEFDDSGEPASEDEIALAVGGEGAAELEAVAPSSGDEGAVAVEGVKRVVIPPITEKERDELRAKMAKRHPSTRGLEAGPDGQMISTGRKAAGRMRYEN